MNKLEPEFFLWYFSVNSLEEAVIDSEFNRLKNTRFSEEHGFDYDKSNIIIHKINTYSQKGAYIQILYNSDYKYPKGVTRPISSNKYLRRAVNVDIGIYRAWVRDKKLESVLV